MARAVFPRWTNKVFRDVLVGVAILSVLLVCAFMAEARERPVTGQDQMIEQPVAFDHRHHVLDDGIDCRFCHDGVERSSYAGVPPTSRCMSCHVQVWSHSPALDVVRLSLANNQPIQWRRVHHLPDFVYFDHSAHTARGIGCVSCHGRVDQMAKVYQVMPLTMGWCLDCHRHPENALRPLGHITDMTWAPAPSDQQSIGAGLAAQWHIAPPVDCSGCHR